MPCSSRTLPPAAARGRGGSWGQAGCWVVGAGHCPALHGPGMARHGTTRHGTAATGVASGGAGQGVRALSLRTGVRAVAVPAGPAAGCSQVAGGAG